MTLHESALEAVAEALYAEECPRGDWDDLTEDVKESYRVSARTAITAYQTALRVTTRDELNALPVGAVVLTEGCVFQRAGVNYWTETGYTWHAGSDDIALPALVLHVPEATP